MNERPLDLMRLKLRRANERLDALKRQLHRHGQRHPIVIGTKLHFKSGWHTSYVREVELFPQRFAIPVGESLYHGRSVLEHLVWALAEAGNETPGENHTFPLLKAPPTPKKRESTRDAFIRSEGGGRLAGVDPAAIAVIEGLQPYKRGNDPYYVLTILNEMARDDRHHALHVTQVYMGDPRHLVEGSLRLRPGTSIIDWKPLFRTGDRLEAGTKLARFRLTRYRRYPQVGVETKLPVDIAFGDRGLQLPDFRRINTELAELLSMFEEFL